MRRANGALPGQPFVSASLGTSDMAPQPRNDASHASPQVRRAMALGLVVGVLAVGAAGWWAIGPELSVTAFAETIRSWGMWGRPARSV